MIERFAEAWWGWMAPMSLQVGLLILIVVGIDLGLRLASVIVSVFFMLVFVLPMAGGEPSSDATSTEDAVASGPPGATAASSEKSALSKGLPSADCVEKLRAIEKLRDQIPWTFRGLKRPAKEIDQDAQRLIELCQEFLKECEGAEAQGRVKATLARMLFARSGIVRSALAKRRLGEASLRAEMDEYFAQAQ